MKFIFLLLSLFFLKVQADSEAEGLQSLVNQLDSEQKKELDVIKNEKTLTKAQFQAKIESFIEKLPETLKVRVCVCRQNPDFIRRDFFFKTLFRNEQLMFIKKSKTYEIRH